MKGEVRNLASRDQVFASIENIFLEFTIVVSCQLSVLGIVSIGRLFLYDEPEIKQEIRKKPNIPCLLYIYVSVEVSVSFRIYIGERF